MEQYIIFPVFSFSFTITNIAFSLLIAVSLTIILGRYKINEGILTNNWGILSESLFRTILGKIENFIGPSYSIYLPFFYSIFHLILFSNLLGLIPYTSTATVEIIKTLSFALTLLIGILFIGFLTHSFRILAIFLPGGTPLILIPLKIILELLAYISRTISLGLRLAINLITGHILAKVCAGFLWLGYIHGTSIFILSIGFILLTLFFVLEILVAY